MTWAHRSWLILPTSIAALTLVACSDFGDHPPASTGEGDLTGSPGSGANTFSPGSSGEPTSRSSSGTSSTADGGVDLEDGGAFTNVGTGDGTSGGIPGAGGLGATGTGDGTSGGVSGAAGLGATGNGVAVPADAGLGSGTIIIAF